MVRWSRFSNDRLTTNLFTMENFEDIILHCTIEILCTTNSLYDKNDFYKVLVTNNNDNSTIVYEYFCKYEVDLILSIQAIRDKISKNELLMIFQSLSKYSIFINNKID